MYVSIQKITYAQPVLVQDLSGFKFLEHVGQSLDVSKTKS